MVIINMQAQRVAVLAIFLTILAFIVLVAVRVPSAVAQPATSFSFTAAGDHGSTTNGDTIASLNTLAAAGVDFHLAVGDLSYMSPGTETTWCNFVKSSVGSTFPFEIVSGNHDSDGLNGLIDNFAICLPDRMGNIVGTYGKEYYFDYPASAPLARIIMIGADLNFTNGGLYDYSVGSVHYTWLADAIDSARSAAIPWVIVATHKNCISMGTKNCSIGSDLTNLLFNKRVDLVLQAHDHNYQRSKQLTCATVNSYNASCVVDDGSDNIYAKDAGTVLVINGAFGQGQYTINTGDSEAGYFASWMGSNINSTFGFNKYTITQTQVSAQFVRSAGGTFSDSFSIISTATPSPSPSPSPSPTPTASPSGSPSPSPSSSGVPTAGNFEYAYYVDSDRRSYTLWTRLENTSDPQAYLNPSRICQDIPPDPKYNYCKKGP